MRPIVFLDINDALTPRYCTLDVQLNRQPVDFGRDKLPEMWPERFLPAAVANLRKLHDAFMPQYVMTSTWTEYLTLRQFKSILTFGGAAFVVENLHRRWYTPHSVSSSRGDEIMSWLADYSRPRPFIVIDGEDSGESLRVSQLAFDGHVVLCRPRIGFATEQLAVAMELMASVTSSSSAKPRGGVSLAPPPAWVTGAEWERALIEDVNFDRVLQEAIRRAPGPMQTEESIRAGKLFMEKIRTDTARAVSARIKLGLLIDLEDLRRRWGPENRGALTPELLRSLISIVGPKGQFFYPVFYVDGTCSFSYLCRVTKRLRCIPNPAKYFFLTAKSFTLGMTPLEALVAGRINAVLTLAGGFATR